MKQRFYALLVLVTGAGVFSLVTIVISPAPLVKAWFVYQKGDPLDPKNYTRTIGSPECHGHSKLCAVYAEVSKDNQFQPSFKSLEELAAQSSNFSREVPGLVSQRGPDEVPLPSISGHFEPPSQAPH